MEVRRGDLVIVSAPGNYEKPRPALIIQSNLFDMHPSIILALITSDLRDTPLFRITVHPTLENGLNVVSQVMIDKLITMPTDKIGEPFGKLSHEEMIQINRALLLFLDLP